LKRKIERKERLKSKIDGNGFKAQKDKSFMKIEIIYENTNHL
jgi:hypothetical protein